MSVRLNSSCNGIQHGRHFFQSLRKEIVPVVGIGERFHDTGFKLQVDRLEAYPIFFDSRPVSVPVLEPNLSDSIPICWSMLT